MKNENREKIDKKLKDLEFKFNEQRKISNKSLFEIEGRIEKSSEKNEKFNQLSNYFFAKSNIAKKAAEKNDKTCIGSEKLNFAFFGALAGIVGGIKFYEGAIAPQVDSIPAVVATTGVFGAYGAIAGDLTATVLDNVVNKASIKINDKLCDYYSNKADKEALKQEAMEDKMAQEMLDFDYELYSECDDALM